MFGATVGAFIGGSLTDSLGRKKTILLSDVLTIIGPLIQFLATTVSAICVGRVILGLGMGISMMSSQVYLSEQSPSALKGQICPTYFFACFIGFILAHLSSIVFAYDLPVMLGLGLLPNLLQLLLMILT